MPDIDQLSAAVVAQARQAFQAGARGVTHLFNAMSQIGNREPGLAGAALEALVLGTPEVQRVLDGATPKKLIIVPGRIVNVVV